MVYSFDPKYWNGTIFLFKEWRLAGNSYEFLRNNQPIPASFFPKSISIERANATLPDLFHTYRGLIILSERARVVVEKLAPGQVEFIPVTIEAMPTSWLNPVIDVYLSLKDLSRTIRATFGARIPFYPIDLEPVSRISLWLNLASAYYFINVLGRAQRLLWLEMPTSRFQPQKDGVERFTMEHDFGQWKLRERAAGEPMIWHESHWRTNNREYRGHTHIFIEDVLWQELDAKFPGQLNALRVGK